MTSMGFDYTAALVRGVPDSFVKALQLEAQPIDAVIARAQHEEYNALIRSLVGEVVEIPADEELPDCVFIEDTV